MGAAMKLLLMSALLRMGACKCWFDRLDYGAGGAPYGQYLPKTKACFQPQCIDDNWEYKGQLDLTCGLCLFGGEPLVFTFDNLVNKGIGAAPHRPTGPELDYNLISVNNDGEYVMTQPGIDKPPSSVGPDAFGVTGHFVDGTEIAPGGECGATGYTNCINGLIYYEDNLAVKLQIIDNSIKVYQNDGYEKWVPFPTTSTAKVDMTSGVAALHVGSDVTDVKILVIEVPVIIIGGRDCTVVIGSKGLTAWLCKEGAYSVPGYPWAGIYASKGLQSTSAYPPNTTPAAATGRLYGLCNSWTDATVIQGNPATKECFYKQIEGANHGVCEKDWQWGRSKDHNTRKWDIRKLFWKVANTWEVPI